MNTTRVRKKTIVKLLYIDHADTLFIERGYDIVAGKEYRLLAIDGYHDFGYIQVKGGPADGYAVMLEQIGIKNRG